MTNQVPECKGMAYYKIRIDSLFFMKNSDKLTTEEKVDKIYDILTALENETEQVTKWRTQKIIEKKMKAIFE